MQRAIAAARKAFDDGPGQKYPPTSVIAPSCASPTRWSGARGDAEDPRRGAAATYIGAFRQVDAPIEQARAYAELALRFEFEKQRASPRGDGRWARR